jgi:hypothetical protein
VLARALVRICIQSLPLARLPKLPAPCLSPSARSLARSPPYLHGRGSLARDIILSRGLLLHVLDLLLHRRLLHVLDLLLHRRLLHVLDLRLRLLHVLDLLLRLLRVLGLLLRLLRVLGLRLDLLLRHAATVVVLGILDEVRLGSDRTTVHREHLSSSGLGGARRLRRRGILLLLLGPQLLPRHLLLPRQLLLPRHLLLLRLLLAAVAAHRRRSAVNSRVEGAGFLRSKSFSF